MNEKYIKCNSSPSNVIRKTFCLVSFPCNSLNLQNVTHSQIIGHQTINFPDTCTANFLCLHPSKRPFSQRLRKAVPVQKQIKLCNRYRSPFEIMQNCNVYKSFFFSNMQKKSTPFHLARGDIFVHFVAKAIQVCY